jgi:hypothetical protein
VPVVGTLTLHNCKYPGAHTNTNGKVLFLFFYKVKALCPVNIIELWGESAIKQAKDNTDEIKMKREKERQREIKRERVERERGEKPLFSKF